MFKAIGHEHFMHCALDDNYAAKLFNGSKPMTLPLLIEDENFKTLESYTFFKERIKDPDYIRTMNDIFDVPFNLEKNLDYFCLACALCFRDFVTILEESITKTFKDYYLEAMSTDFATELTTSSTLETPFIVELENRCPLCGIEESHLIYDYKGTYYSNCEVVEIYPSTLPAGKINDFNAIKKKPLNLASTNNKIALCKKHAQLYKNTYDLEIYKELVGCKEQIIINKRITEEDLNSDLKERVEKVLSFLLKDNTFDSDATLSSDALKISDKIPESDHMTINAYSSYVLNYYQIIDKYLCENEGRYEDSSTELGKKIKKISDDLMDAGLSYKQVLDKLREMLLSILPADLKDDTAIRILIGYFLQHCEVLHNENA